MSVSTTVDTGMFETGQFWQGNPVKSLDDNGLWDVPRGHAPCNN